MTTEFAPQAITSREVVHTLLSVNHLLTTLVGFHICVSTVQLLIKLLFTLIHLTFPPHNLIQSIAIHEIRSLIYQLYFF